MRVLFYLFCIGFLLCTVVTANSKSDFEDNEFAEFEDDDTPVEQVTEAPSQSQKPATKKNENVEDDYGVEDFETGGVVRDEVEEVVAEPKVEKLKFADVPAHFRSTWASYQVEAIILFIIAVYLVNYVTGRAQNQSQAQGWFEKCKPLLQEQFALVGDDGVGDNLAGGVLVRETDSSYLVWCSGRVGVQSLLIQLRTMKRQDLLSRVLAFFTPQNDRFTMKFELDAGEQDPFVMAFGQKKSTTKQVKELLDLSTYTTEKKNATFNLPASFTLFSEQVEATYALFDNAVCGMLKKHEKAVEYIHISDQFSGAKPPEGETFTKMPPTSSMLQFSFNLNECTDEESLTELINLVFYIVEKVRKLRLSKEAKGKADKRRREVVDVFMKTTHQIRQEAAQARREEKTRERKQRLMEEEDPEKQRRLEKLELKREAKSKQPKMKQLKMKM